MRHSQVDESLAALGQVLVVFDKSAVLAQPCKCPLHNRSLRLNSEALRGSVSSDYLNEPPATLPHPAQPFTTVCRISPYDYNSGVQAPGKLKQPLPAVSILHTGRTNNYQQHQAHCVYKQVSLASFYPLSSVNSRSRCRACRVEERRSEGPPFSVLLTTPTDWLSRTAAEGSGSLPASIRTSLRNTELICSNNPASRQIPKYQCTGTRYPMRGNHEATASMSNHSLQGRTGH